MKCQSPKCSLSKKRKCHYPNSWIEFNSLLSVNRLGLLFDREMKKDLYKKYKDSHFFSPIKVCDLLKERKTGENNKTTTKYSETKWLSQDVADDLWKILLPNLKINTNCLSVMTSFIPVDEVAILIKNWKTKKMLTHTKRKINRYENNECEYLLFFLHDVDHYYTIIVEQTRIIFYDSFGKKPSNFVKKNIIIPLQVMFKIDNYIYLPYKKQYDNCHCSVWAVWFAASWISVHKENIIKTVKISELDIHFLRWLLEI